MPPLPQHFFLTLELTLGLDSIELVVFFFSRVSLISPEVPHGRN